MQSTMIVVSMLSLDNDIFLNINIIPFTMHQCMKYIKKWEEYKITNL